MSVNNLFVLIATISIVREDMFSLNHPYHDGVFLSELKTLRKIDVCLLKHKSSFGAPKFLETGRAKDILEVK